MITISIIIPTFNGAQTLNRCLDAIRTQTGVGEKFVLELIAVDDHSTDQTWDLLTARPDVTALKTEAHTGGPNAGRNIGLRQAQGDFIALIDQDDEWQPDKLLSQLQVAQTSQVPIVFCDFQIFDQLSHKTDYYSDRSGQLVMYPPQELFLKLLKFDKDFKRPLPLMSTLFFHRRLKTIYFEQNFGCCDYDYLLHLFENQAAARICTPFVIRHVHQENFSMDPSYRRIAYYFNLMTLEQYEDRFPRQVAASIRRMNGTRARYFYKIGHMRQARKYFLRSTLDWKTLAFFITSFLNTRWIKRHFRIFGT